MTFLLLNSSSYDELVAATPKQFYVSADHEARVGNDNKVIEVEALLEVIYQRYHGIALVLSSVEQRI